MKEPRPLLRLAIVFFCVVLLVAIAIPNFIHEPNTSPKNTCINNLRLFDAAKEEWALEHQKTNSDTPSWTDIKPYVTRADEDLPKCPSGGTYTLGAISNPPTCSISGHVLPQ